MMKYWMIMLCLCLAGCGSSGPTNIVENADQAALDAYEQAIAEADQMAIADGDTEVEQ